MKKKLIIINGTMGVGKSTLVKNLYKQIDNSVWLDGDWCWLMNPWNITEENKAMAMKNIHFILNQYLQNSMFEYIFFTWVIHKESIFEEILGGLSSSDFDLMKVTITCSEEDLKTRMVIDRRRMSDIEHSVKRLKCYDRMDTIKVNTSDSDITESIRKLYDIVTDY